jgi:uncharacterized protein with HEPN domain
MDKEVNLWLADIEQAISEINQFLPNQEDFEAFQNDLKTKRAIERNIEIIGEAMNRILKAKPDFPISTARKIIDTRNRIIHGYDDVSDQIIWTIVVEYLGELQREIEALKNK